MRDLPTRFLESFHLRWCDLRLENQFNLHRHRKLFQCKAALQFIAKEGLSCNIGTPRNQLIFQSVVIGVVGVGLSDERRGWAWLYLRRTYLNSHQQAARQK